MDIEHLKTFVAVAQHQSFSLAAKKLHLTQPAISKRILALEDKVGGPLFDRINKQVILSPIGHELLPKAHVLIQDFEDLLLSIRSASDKITGELHIATSHHLGIHKLPAILQRYTKEFPDVNLRLEFLDSEIAFKRVLDGACEIALATIAPKIPPNLHSETLWHEPIVFVTHKNSNIPTSINLRQLSKYPAILPDLSTYTGRLIDQFFKEQNIPLLINMATNYFETLKMLVGIGFGWSALPAAVVDQELQIIDVEGVNLSRKLGVIHHKKRTPSRQAQEFLALLRNEI